MDKFLYGTAILILAGSITVVLISAVTARALWAAGEFFKGIPMSGDGMKTTSEQRKRTQRNKIVSTLTAIGGAALTIEQTAPGILPPGSGVVMSQLSALSALLVNQFWPK